MAEGQLIRRAAWAPCCLAMRVRVPGLVLFLDLAAWARRRMRHCDPDECGWLETVVGALAAEVKAPVSRRPDPPT